MSDNKFIQRLKGTQTPGALVEIKSDKRIQPFENMPSGDGISNTFEDDRNAAIGVLKGAQNWLLNGAELIQGDGGAYTSEFTVSGTGLWLNSFFAYPLSSDPNNPIVSIINPNSKWVLYLAGKNLLSENENIDFTLIVKVGTTNIAAKEIKLRRQAGYFYKRAVVDFSESKDVIIRVSGGQNLTLQLICQDESATANIYNGMTGLSLLQRRVDAAAVSADNMNLTDLTAGYIVPVNYFSQFVDDVDDGANATPIFTRNGTEMNLTGWGISIDLLEETLQENINAKLDRVDSEGNYDRLYGVTSGAEQIMYDVDQADATPDTIARRTDRGQVKTTAPDLDYDAANKKYVDDIKEELETDIDGKLSLSGGTMSGDIDMGNNNLLGADTVEARYIRSPDYKTDTAIYMKGEVRLEGNRLGELGEPVTAPDATNKGYVDAADEVLQEQITENTEDIAALDAAKINISAVPKGTSGATLNKRTLLQAITIDSTSASSAIISGWSADIESDGAADIETQVAMPIADEDHAGLMPAADHNQIETNTADIEVLKGASKRYAVHLGTDPLTQAQYQTAWEVASGSATGTTPPDGSTLVNLDNNHAITYFANQVSDKWVDRGIDTIGVATQTALGAVKGSTAAGQGYIESDGTISLVGYDSLTTGIANNTAAIAGKANQSDLTSHTSNTSNPHSVTKTQIGLGNVDNTSDANKPVSTAQATAIAGKLDKVSTASKIYATDASGNQTTLEYSSAMSPSCIVQRYTNSHISVPATPTDSTHATSKEYVDTCNIDCGTI
jgi:hypothetical protein